MVEIITEERAEGIMKRSECIEMEELAREEKDEEVENTGHWGSLQTDGRAEEVCVRYL